MHTSVSHDGDYTFATVIVEQPDATTQDKDIGGFE